MNVLILGSGGREHTMAWKIAQSKMLSNLYIAPGNAGTSQVGTNLNVSVNDFASIKEIVLKYEINLVVVGPEDPLVKGIRNFFEDDNELKQIPIIGPDKIGAQLEGSKEFAKEFMVKYKIPTAAYGSFTLETLKEAEIFLEKMKAPYVLKADGLSAGKGVLIIDDLVEAKTTLKTMLKGQFGDASRKVVIEEFLSGIEVSYFIVTDGDNYLLLPEAKDYKRIGEKDTGLNTGGMGAISPIPFANKEFTQKVIERIIEPTVNGLKAEGILYQGFIFFGLIKVNNEPMVIEYNARMGDPETEVVLPRIDADFLELMAAIPTKSLKKVPFAIKPDTAATVMMVSGGYPGDYEKGKVMTGFNLINDSIAFHAGTTVKNNQIVTNGGRVLAITSMGKNRQQALELSYKNVELIKYANRYFRRDIGFDL